MAIRDLANVVVAGVQASEADRANLHTQADAAQAQAAAAATAANNAASAVAAATAAASAATAAASAATAAANAAKAAADKVAADLVTMNARRARSAPAVTVPAMLSLLNGSASVDVDVTWTTAWPDTDYQVEAILDLPPSLLGKVSASVKAKTTTKATLTITTTAVLSASTCTVRGISVTT